jgi:DNA-binding response OmpR family regulator
MAQVAIVEDDLTIAQMYRLKLEADGHHVQIAANGRLGLALCQETTPQIVLLDLMMPEMNGDEMLEKMRHTDWGKDIKVLVLTNVGQQEAPSRLQALGVSQYIVKAEMTPAQVAELVRKELGGG